MNNLLLLPPIAFLVVLIFVAFQLMFFGKYGCKAKTDVSSGKCKPYACGEDVPLNKVNPEYRQFFSFAFFFTIMHVVALVVTTYPSKDINALSISLVYVIGAVTGLVILFRK